MLSVVRGSVSVTELSSGSGYDTVCCFLSYAMTVVMLFSRLLQLVTCCTECVLVNNVCLCFFIEL